jgi:hypothetical protein
MTLPDERYRAMKCGYQFLLDLCNPSATPRVPKEIRQRASSILKHYPSQYHFELIASALPNEFDKIPFMVKLREKNINDEEFDPPPSVA